MKIVRYTYLCNHQHSTLSTTAFATSDNEATYDHPTMTTDTHLPTNIHAHLTFDAQNKNELKTHQRTVEIILQTILVHVKINMSNLFALTQSSYKKAKYDLNY